MKKDKAWFMGEIDKNLISETFSRLELRMDLYELECLIDQLDEPEALLQQWIDKNKVARINNLRKMTASDVVPVEKLENLLVPNQKKQCFQSLLLIGLRTIVTTVV